MISFPKRLRSHLTYANVMATLAVFLVVSGGPAMAAKTLIDGRSLKNDSVTGAKVRNGSLAAADLSSAARRSLKGAKGEAGAAGVQGEQGERGVQGAAGPRGPEGAQGLPGIQGLQGLQGIQGAQGPAGDDGVVDLARTTFVTVSSSAGVSGSDLRAAIDAVPAGNEEWTIVLESGTYDVGGSSLDLAPNTNLVGQGIGVTTISGSAAGGGVIAYAPDSPGEVEIANLTVRASTGGVPARAITIDTGNVRARNVRFEAESSGGDVTAIEIKGDGINGGGFDGVNVEVDSEAPYGGTADGIHLSHGSVTVRSSTVAASASGANRSNAVRLASTGGTKLLTAWSSRLVATSSNASALLDEGDSANTHISKLYDSNAEGAVNVDGGGVLLLNGGFVKTVPVTGGGGGTLSCGNVSFLGGYAFKHLDADCVVIP